MATFRQRLRSTSVKLVMASFELHDDLCLSDVDLDDNLGLIARGRVHSARLGQMHVAAKSLFRFKPDDYGAPRVKVPSSLSWLIFV